MFVAKIIPLEKVAEKKESNRQFYENTFHNLRHSTASILFEQGWQAKDIQEWLGHADIYTTMNIYTHLSKAHKEEKSRSLEGIFSENTNLSQISEP